MDPKTELLNQLHDIDLPPGSGWPVAPGWIAMAVLLLALAVVVYLKLRRRGQSDLVQVQTNWQAPAMLELNAIESRFQRGDTNSILADCSRLARRVTLAKAGRRDVAALTGQAWLEKLNELSHSDFFTVAPGNLLASAPYKKSTVNDQTHVAQILAAMKQLIHAPNPSAPREDI